MDVISRIRSETKAHTEHTLWVLSLADGKASAFGGATSGQPIGSVFSPTAGGVTQQLTFDRTQTQPAWSPDGRRLAFTVWSYDVQCWTLAP
jgi:Tol biopolymer transport system component